jgi:hypothetical protein
MSRVKTLALTVGVLFALASCAPFFEFNLFGAMDTPATPTAADYQGSGGLDQLGEDLNSPAVVDALAGAPTLVATIMTNLATDYLGITPPFTVSDQTDQQAAILYADLALKTTEGENLVNNIVDVIAEVITGGGGIDTWISGTTNVADLLSEIVPPEALASEAVFTAMVNAFLAANDAYIALGASIDKLATFGEADPGATLPPGSLPGDIAQKAILAHAMWAVVEAVKVGPPVMGEPAAITEMFLIAKGKPCSLILGAFAQPPDAIEALIDFAGFMP